MSLPSVPRQPQPSVKSCAPSDTAAAAAAAAAKPDKAMVSAASSAAVKPKTKKASAPSVVDPKGPFEAERMWRAVGADPGRKAALAAALLRPDGAVAHRLFGAKSSGTLDAAVLADMLVHRLHRPAGAEGRRAGDGLGGHDHAAQLQLALAALAAAPRFRNSALFLSAAQQADVVRAIGAHSDLQGPAGDTFRTAVLG
jgi:hypothetical protein